MHAVNRPHVIGLQASDAGTACVAMGTGCTPVAAHLLFGQPLAHGHRLCLDGRGLVNRFPLAEADCLSSASTACACNRHRREGPE